MLGIYLSIGVALFKALGELAGKIYTDTKKDNSIDEYSLVLGARFFSSIVLGVIILYIGIPSISWDFLLVLMCSSLLGTIANITALKAVKYGDLSIVGPLTALTIPFLIVTTFFINGESLNLYGYIGVLSIFIGTYFLGVSKKSTSLIDPLKSVFQEPGAKYMLITTILWSVTAPLDKIGIENVGIFSWMFLTNTLIVVFIAIYMICIKKNFSLRNLLQTKSIQKSFSISVIGGIGIFLQMLAYKYTLVVYVIAIKRASGIFSVILGYFFYKEKNIAWKLFAVMIMLVGVFLISILGNI